MEDRLKGVRVRKDVLGKMWEERGIERNRVVWEWWTWVWEEKILNSVAIDYIFY